LLLWIRGVVGYSNPAQLWRSWALFVTGSVSSKYLRLDRLRDKIWPIRDISKLIALLPIFLLFFSCMWLSKSGGFWPVVKKSPWKIGSWPVEKKHERSTLSPYVSVRPRRSPRSGTSASLNLSAAQIGSVTEGSGGWRAAEDTPGAREVYSVDVCTSSASPHAKIWHFSTTKLVRELAD
jgi:hypothetical protein